MGIEIHSGAASLPEQPRINSAATNKPPQTNNRNKGIIIAATIGILCVAVVLISVVVPNWSSHDNGNRKDNKVASEMDSATVSKRKMPNKPNKPKKKQNATVTKAPIRYTSSTGTFNVSVPLFSPDVLKGYASLKAARADFVKMAKFILNGQIANGGLVPPMRGQALPSMAAGQAAGSDGKEGGSSPPPVGDGATDFETNNQEDNVDRADLAKSNGEFLFTAYGEYILVMDVASGTIVNRISMDPIEVVNTECGSVGYPGGPRPPVELEPVVNETSATDGTEKETNNSSSTSSFATTKTMVWNPCWYRPTPYIQALAVSGDRLTVVVSGYGVEHTQNLEVQPTLWEYLATRILVYDINGGKLILLSTKDVNGSYLNAYTIGGNTHIVTQAGVNTWDKLVMPIQRWEPAFEGMSDDEYKIAVKRLAQKELIPNFVDDLLADIQAAGVDIRLVRLSVFANSVSSDGDLEMSLWGGGYANSLTHVVSIDMNQPQAVGDELTTSIAATFLPTSGGQVYSNEDMLFVAAQGWDWVAARGASTDTTYLVGFELQGAASMAKVTGSVPGYLLNPYSLDFYNGYLRVATTQTFWTPIRFFPVVVLDEVVMGPTSNTSSSSSSENATTIPNNDTIDDSDASRTLNQIIILKVPATTNANVTTLKQVGSVQLGKKNEMFTTVRFFDTIAYAVTFERTDPFYVLDLSDDENPIVLGELEIPGFSSYLHSINADHTKLVAVGQHANADGIVLGLKISLFDATTPTQPRLIAEHLEEKQENTFSSSEVEWDQQAFRYLNLGSEMGRIIIPMSIYVWNNDVWPMLIVEAESVNGTSSASNATTTATTTIAEGESFDGFAVFSVANDKIERQFYISHVGQTLEATNSFYNPGCWACGWLTPRSFVFNGDVVTMKGHSILRSDLDTGDLVWDTHLNDEKSGMPQCCGY